MSSITLIFLCVCLVSVLSCGDPQHFHRSWFRRLQSSEEMQQQQPTDWTGPVSARPLLHHAGQSQVQRLPDSQAPRVPRLGAPRRDAQTHAALRRQITCRQSCARYPQFLFFNLKKEYTHYEI